MKATITMLKDKKAILIKKLNRIRILIKENLLNMIKYKIKDKLVKEKNMLLMKRKAIKSTNSCVISQELRTILI